MMTICIPCGYVYQGDENFESLNKDGCCPECGGSIKNFEVIDETLTEMSDEVLSLSLGQSGE